MSDIIPGLKLIKHNAGGVNEVDDPSFPYKLEAIFRITGFMIIASVMTHGGNEEIVVRGMTKEAIEKLIDVNDLRRHPRLIRLTVTGPEGVVFEITR